MAKVRNNISLKYAKIANYRCRLNFDERSKSSEDTPCNPGEVRISNEGDDRRIFLGGGGGGV